MSIPAPHRERLNKGGIFLLCAAATAFVGAPAAYFATKFANTVLVVQQRQLTEVQQLDATGAVLDNAVRGFSDSLANGEGLSVSRDKLRDAVGAHSAAAFAMQKTFGENYSDYMSKINSIRSLADHAETAREGVIVWQAAVDAIAMRKQISDRIKRDVEGM